MTFYVHLLRVKCESKPQADLLRKMRDSSSVIRQALFSKPTADVGRGSEWHIGNVEDVSPDGVAFAIGRTSATKSPRFDQYAHNFLEEEMMSAPFTIGVFDLRHQSCGIIKKSGVSQSASEIATKLQTLLNSTSPVLEANAVIVVDPVLDPENFIQAIRRAAVVTKFRFTVSRPNPADVNRLIQRPAEEFTEAAGGDRSVVQTEGEDLDRDLLEEVAKAVASVGEEASATIKPERGARSKLIRLGGNPVSEAVQPSVQEGLLSAILRKTRESYDRIRFSAKT